MMKITIEHKTKVMGMRMHIQIQNAVTAVLFLVLLGFTPEVLKAIQGQTTAQVQGMTLTELQQNFYKAELEMEISVMLDEVSLDKALSQIAKEAGLKLTYRGDILTERSIALQRESMSVSEALEYVLEGTGLDYQVSQDGYLLISRISEFDQEELIQETLRGRITDSQTGEALPGVNILLQGTTVGTATNIDGEFELSVPTLDEVLIVSYIGYQTQEISIDGRIDLEISLVPRAYTGDDLIVIGYGTQRRGDVTSSVSSVNVEGLQRSVTTDATLGMRGNVPGVNIAPVDGSPGASVNINIRGIATFGNTGNEPLVIVDGVEIQGLQFFDFENNLGRGGPGSTTGIENINPNDIESIEVLKDASAAAIYGSRAANGVILITTKRGEAGATRVNYNSYVGQQWPYTPLSMSNSEQYIQILQSMYGQQLDGPGSQDLPQAARDYLNNPGLFQDYNWQELVYTPASMHSHDLSVAGGGDFGNYRISAGYMDHNGIALDTRSDRYNIRGNSDFIINDNITIGQSLALSRTHTEPEPYAFSRSTLYKSLKQLPYFSPKTEEGDYRTVSFYYGGGDNPENLIRNPLHYASIWSRNMQNNSVSANLYADLDLIEGLNYRVSGSYAFTELKTVTQVRERGNEYFNANRSLEDERVSESNWNMDHIIRYVSNLGSHNFNIMGGFVVQSFRSEYIGGFRMQYLSDRTTTLSAPGGQNTGLWGGHSEHKMLSFMSQVSYNYDDRYLMTLNFRRDGSSRFSPDNRWGNFPGVSLGWRLSNERFWQNSAVDDVLSNFVLRAGYGVLGRQNTGNYAWQPTLNYTPAAFGDSYVDGVITGTPINPNITWELLYSENIGLDFELFEGRFGGSFEYYRQTTEDMILGVNTPLSVGGGSILQNIGEIENTGFEMELNYFSGFRDDFTYNIGFNLSTNSTTLTNIGRAEGREGVLPVWQSSPEWDVPHVIEMYQGRGIAEFWLIETDGIFRNWDEVNAHSVDGQLIQPNAQPGDIRFVDYNGDGQITDSDRQYMGTGIPKMNMGINFTAGYKNFDVAMTLYGAFGHHVFNGPQYLIEQPYLFNNYSTNLLNAFDPDTNPNSDFPRNNPNDLAENWNSRPTSDRYLEKGDYVKLHNLQVGYNLPADLSNRIGLNSAQIYLRGQNLYTFTGYSGFDPEIGRDGFWAAGIDRGGAPQVRSFSIGFNIEI